MRRGDVDRHEVVERLLLFLSAFVMLSAAFEPAMSQAIVNPDVETERALRRVQGVSVDFGVNAQLTLQRSGLKVARIESRGEGNSPASETIIRWSVDAAGDYKVVSAWLNDIQLKWPQCALSTLALRRATVATPTFTMQTEWICYAFDKK